MGDAAVGAAPQSWPHLGGTGYGDEESSGDEEVETWKEKPHSSIRRMGEMQMALSNTSGPQEGGRRGLMDGGCLEGAQPARCPPLHVSAPVPHRPLPQFPLWGCQGWQEEPGELDEPSQDLTTRAGSIPPVLQARARLAPATANPPWGKMPQNCPGRVRTSHPATPHIPALPVPTRPQKHPESFWPRHEHHPEHRLWAMQHL